MQEVPALTGSPDKPATALVPSRRLRVWLIAISILAILLFLIDAVFAFAMISASFDHLKTASKSISASNDIIVPYSVVDFHNDLEVEIPSILITLVVLAAGPVGGWVLLKRKPTLAFVISLLVPVSFLTTFLLGVLLVFS